MCVCVPMNHIANNTVLYIVPSKLMGAGLLENVNA